MVLMIASVDGLRAQSTPPSPHAPAQATPATPSPPTAPVLSTSPAPAGPSNDAHPIAIVPLDSKIPGHAAEVTGALQVNDGRAIIAASAAITSGTETTHVTLPYRGTMLICASTTVKLAVDSSVPAGDVPGLLLAMDHGAVELSFATSHNSDTLLTPDFRILISGPGAAEVKVRLGAQGDTCIDNTGEPSGGSSSLVWKAGVNAPYVLVSSVFDGGVYRVQPGQRVMFQHGSLHEVVDQEREPCGCPPSAPKENEFPLAQSEGLSPMPKPAPASPNPIPATKEPVAPLVYNSAGHSPEIATIPEPTSIPPTETSAKPAAPKPAPARKRGFFKKLGHFFGRIFGAE